MNIFDLRKVEAIKFTTGLRTGTSWLRSRNSAVPTNTVKLNPNNNANMAGPYVKHMA